MAKKLQILRGTTAQNNVYTGSIGELTMDTEKVEVRIHDGITQGGKTIGSGGANLPILTHVFSDHKLNDISWLNADTFSWQSGDVYVAAYEHLVSDIAVSDDGYITTENGVVFNRDSSKDKDGLIAWASTDSTTIYTSNPPIIGETPSAWDDNRQVWGAYGSTISSGSNVAYQERISSITITYYKAEDGHKICLADQEANVQALYEATGVAWYYILDTANKQFKLPREHKDGKCLYFYVGNFEQSALEQTAGLNAELFNGKADTSSVQALESRTDALEERDYVVASQMPTSSNNYTWYRKYKSGWVEQGVATLISGGDAVVITLPVPMSSINYNILLSQYNSDTTVPNLNRLSFYNQTATGFSVISRYTNSNVARSFLWKVCGQAA